MRVLRTTIWLISKNQWCRRRHPVVGDSRKVSSAEMRKLWWTEISVASARQENSEQQMEAWVENSTRQRFVPCLEPGRYPSPTPSQQWWEWCPGITLNSRELAAIITVMGKICLLMRWNSSDCAPTCPCCLLFRAGPQAKPFLLASVTHHITIQMLCSLKQTT